MKIHTLLFFLIYWNLLPNYCLAQEKPEIVVTNGHISNVTAVTFSPDNQFIATGSMDRTIRIWSRSLQQEFRVLYGHSTNVEQVTYSSNGKYIMSLDGDRNFITWEHSTGKIVYKTKLPLSVNLRTFAYIANTQKVLIVNNGKLVQMDILTGVFSTSQGRTTGMSFIASPSGKYILSQNSEQSNQIDVLDYKNETIIQRLTTSDEQNTVLNIAVSSSEKYSAILTQKNNKVIIWNLQTGERLKEFATAKGQSAFKILFTPDDKEILVLSRMGGTFAYNIKNGRQTNVINPPTVPDYQEAFKRKDFRMSIPTNLSISPDGQLLAIAGMFIQKKGADAIQETIMGCLLYDYQTNRELGMLRGYYKNVTHLSLSPNGKYLISSSTDKYTGIRIWNLRTGDLERYIPSSGIAHSSKDGKYFVAWVISEKEGNLPVVTIYNSENLKPIFEKAGIEVLRDVTLSPDGSLLLTQEVDLNPSNPLKNRFFCRVWDVQTAAEKYSFDVPMTETPFPQSGQISPDNKHFLAEAGSTVSCWDIKTGERVAQIPIQVAYDHLLDFVPNTNRVIISKTPPLVNAENQTLVTNFEWLEWDYTTGESSHTFKSGRNGVLEEGVFIEEGKYFVTGQSGWHNNIEFLTLVWDWETKEIICRLEGHTGGVKKIVHQSKKNRLYSVGADGVINIWDLDACTLTASMIAYEALDYIILSPNDYYKTSKGNSEGIGFRYNNQLYTFDQFDIRFNQPHKVLRDLGISKFSTRIYEKAWEKRLRKVGFTPEDLEGDLALPIVQMRNKKQIPIQTEQKILNLDIAASDATYPLDRLLIYINDVPVPQLQGFPLSGNSIEKEVPIELSQGKNIVKVSVMNKKGLESLRESFEINYAPKQTKQPDLYLFTIGVSEFEQQDRNLKFATKDAKDLVAKFKKSKQFGKVHTLELYNEEASVANINQANDFLKKAAIDDQIMIYISSHGLLDEQLNYYLAMHTTDFENPAQHGLPYESINQLLNSIDCRNRLVMIDACHSGEVDKEDVASIQKLAPSTNNLEVNTKSGATLIRPKAGLKNSFTYMKTLFDDLSKGTGATVISAAGGFEFALESDDWNNGVFTYAILEGLQSGKADGNQDGIIRVSELKNYVTEQVIKLTEGKQHPTTRSENSLNDPIIFRLR